MTYARTPPNTCENYHTHCQHAGLLMHRHVASDELSDKTAGRRALIAKIGQACGRAEPLYKQAFCERQAWLDELVKAQRCVIWNQRTQGRLLVGVGIDTPLEFGLSLHHLYGTPLIPGSSLKGLARAESARLWGADVVLDDRESATTLMFGAEADRAWFDVLDAWIEPADLEGAIELDVVTPHHPDYQQGRPGAPSEPNPMHPFALDSDMPRPVSTASVCGHFQFAVVAHGAGVPAIWLNAYKDLLQNALQLGGVGARGSAGYGYFGALDA